MQGAMVFQTAYSRLRKLRFQVAMPNMAICSNHSDSHTCDVEFKDYQPFAVLVIHRKPFIYSGQSYCDNSNI